MTDRKSPNQWKVIHFADVGTSEEFVRQFMELYDLLKGTHIFDAEREKVNNALGDIQMEGLIPAFLELRKIRESVGKEMPALNRLQMFEDFARKIWKSYKDLMQPAAKLIGYDLGFLFQKEPQSMSGKKRFRKMNPNVSEEFEDFLTGTRQKWQNELADFRNKVVEHPTVNRDGYRKFYQPEYAEALFDGVFKTIVTILAVLLSTRLPEQIMIEDLLTNDPNRKEWPNRFRLHLVRIQPPNSPS